MTRLLKTKSQRNSTKERVSALKFGIAVHLKRYTAEQSFAPKTAISHRKYFLSFLAKSDNFEKSEIKLFFFHYNIFTRYISSSEAIQ